MPTNDANEQHAARVSRSSSRTRKSPQPVAASVLEVASAPAPACVSTATSTVDGENIKPKEKGRHYTRSKRPSSTTLESIANQEEVSDRSGYLHSFWRLVPDCSFSTRDQKLNSKVTKKSFQPTHALRY